MDDKISCPWLLCHSTDAWFYSRSVGIKCPLQLVSHASMLNLVLTNFTMPKIRFCLAVVIFRYYGINICKILI